jgi:hypothetical protein
MPPYLIKQYGIFAANASIPVASVNSDLLLAGERAAKDPKMSWN